MDTETARSLPAQEFYEKHFRQNPQVAQGALLGNDFDALYAAEQAAHGRVVVPEMPSLQVLAGGEISAEAIYELVRDGRGGEVLSDLAAIEKAS